MIILISLLLLILFELLVLGLFFSKISVRIYELNITKRNGRNEIETIAGEIYVSLFNFFEILKIKIFNNYFSFYGIKVKYDKLFQLINYKNFSKIFNNNYNIFLQYLRRFNFDKIELKIKKCDLNVNLGFSNPILTSAVVTSISSLLPFFIQKYMDKMTENTFRYNVSPNYFDMNNYRINIRLLFSFKLNLLIREMIYFSE